MSQETNFLYNLVEETYNISDSLNSTEMQLLSFLKNIPNVRKSLVSRHKSVNFRRIILNRKPFDIPVNYIGFKKITRMSNSFSVDFFDENKAEKYFTTAVSEYLETDPNVAVLSMKNQNYLLVLNNSEALLLKNIISSNSFYLKAA